jgi:hypothetical protein
MLTHASTMAFRLNGERKRRREGDYLALLGSNEQKLSAFFSLRRMGRGGELLCPRGRGQIGKRDKREEEEKHNSIIIIAIIICLLLGMDEKGEMDICLGREGRGHQMRKWLDGREKLEEKGAENDEIE